MNNAVSLPKRMDATSRFLTGNGIPALILVTALVWLAAISLSHAGVPSGVSSPIFLTVISTASVLVALAAAYVALAEFVLHGRSSSALIGLAFCLFAAGDAGLHLMPLILGGQVRDGSFVLQWSVLDTCAGLLLVGAGWRPDVFVPAVRRVHRAAAGIALVSILAFAAWFSAWLSGPDPTRAPIQLMPAVALLAASVTFWRLSRQTGRTWYFWLSLSLLIAGFAEVQYAFHVSAFRAMQSGDMMRLLFFCSILLALTVEWNQNYARLRWQTRELEALHALMTAPVMHRVSAVAEHIEHVAGATFGGRAHVSVIGREGSDPLTSHLLRMGSQLETQENAAQLLVGFDEGPEGQVALGVPMWSGQQRLGMLVVARLGGEGFSTHDVRLVRAFGAQASALLERSLLHEEIAANAVIGERNRLGREIHDGLAQHLAFLKMQVGWLRRDPARVGHAELQAIEQGLEMALVEARHAIATLRADMQGSSTADVIEGYLEEFSQVVGTPVQSERHDPLPEVSPTARAELLRIVQEALNNVRKHAREARVTVCMSTVRHGLEVIIGDNGPGFDPAQSVQGHFGMSIMRERAESVGGRLDVEAAPGSGTTVRVWLPAVSAAQGAFSSGDAG